MILHPLSTSPAGSWPPAASDLIAAAKAAVAWATVALPVIAGACAAIGPVLVSGGHDLGWPELTAIGTAAVAISTFLTTVARLAASPPTPRPLA